jgi:hypothetical protein
MEGQRRAHLRAAGGQVTHDGDVLLLGAVRA